MVFINYYISYVTSYINISYILIMLLLSLLQFFTTYILNWSQNSSCIPDEHNRGKCRHPVLLMNQAHHNPKTINNTIHATEMIEHCLVRFKAKIWRRAQFLAIKTSRTEYLMVSKWAKMIRLCYVTSKIRNKNHLPNIDPGWCEEFCFASFEAWLILKCVGTSLNLQRHFEIINTIILRILIQLSIACYRMPSLIKTYVTSG